MLDGVNVALGVSGSIAAVKCVELAHELRRQGAVVRAVTTPSAESIINPWSLEFATDRSVITEITGAVEHLELCGTDGWADVFLVAPATANTIGKLAHAIDDTPVTTCGTTALGARLPVVIAPAMHEPMWEHPGVLEAIDTLEGWGVTVVPPRLEESKAKLATEETIITEVARATTPHTLGETHVVVTSGSTSESIDPVRILTSRASGRTGRAIARACYVRGADVTVVHDGHPLPYAETVSVTSTDEMRAACLEASSSADALVSAAAIGDFRVDAADEKLQSGKPLSLDLEPAPKVIDAVRDAEPGLPIVGFKVESNADEEILIAAARRLQNRADLAFVVGNEATVMGAAETRAIIVDGEAVEPVDGSKDMLGHRVASRLADALDGA